MIKVGDSFQATKDFLGDIFTQYSLFTVTSKTGAGNFRLKYSYKGQNSSTVQSQRSLENNFIKVFNLKTILPLP